MNPALISLIEMAISAIASLSGQVINAIKDYESMSDNDKQALIDRIKKIQDSIPEWK